LATLLKRWKDQLTSKEKAEVVANCDHLAKLKGPGQGIPPLAADDEL
jgi:hypothetical protein